MADASVMTYDSLVLNIQTYLERTDTTTIENIPLFIMLAEQVIASQIKFLGNLTVQEQPWWLVVQSSPSQPDGTKLYLLTLLQPLETSLFYSESMSI